jgi:hypothetical protein
MHGKRKSVVDGLDDRLHRDAGQAADALFPGIGKVAPDSFFFAKCV